MNEDWRERDWLETRLRIRDVHVRYATEFRKIGTDHVKLVLTNLHLMNAGGLVAIPALVSFTDQASRPVSERLVAFGPSAIFFVFGLIAATLAALLSYFNSIRKADEIEQIGEHEIARLAQSLPGTTEAYKKSAKGAVDAHEKEVAKLSGKVGKNYRLAHCFGWASLIMFITGSVLLVFSVREVWRLFSA